MNVCAQVQLVFFFFLPRLHRHWRQVVILSRARTIILAMHLSTMKILKFIHGHRWSTFPVAQPIWKRIHKTVHSRQIKAKIVPFEKIHR